MVNNFNTKIPNIINFYRKDFISDIEMWNAASAQMQLLLKSNHVVAMSRSEDNSTIWIEYASLNPDNITVLPFWLSPDDYDSLLDNKDNDPANIA